LQAPSLGSGEGLTDRSAEPPQAQGTVRPPYVPPVAVMLRGLGITELDLRGDSATVSTAFLRFVISEIVKRGAFDPRWYAERYPDVESARLAGEVSSLHQHYCMQGYFEGRVPGELPCDPDWYYSRYEDVAQTYSPADSDGLRDHYETQGWYEGRAGTPEVSKEADRWLAAARGDR
jgi:hypothetical protein